VLTLLRMELHGEQVMVCQRTGEIDSKVAACRNPRLILRNDHVAVHEVKPFTAADVLPQWVVESLLDIVPAHVWDLESRAITTSHVLWKSLHPTTEGAECAGVGIFVG